MKKFKDRFKVWTWVLLVLIFGAVIFGIGPLVLAILINWVGPTLFSLTSYITYWNSVLYSAFCCVVYIVGVLTLYKN